MAAQIDLITPPRGRLGDGITITGTGFAAANNAVRLIEPDGTAHVQAIFSQSTTSIVISALAGAVTPDFQHNVEVTNNDDSSVSTLAWFVPKSLIDLETYRVAAQQPGQFEVLATERPSIAEAKDFERIAALAEFVRDAAVSANAKQIQGVDVDATAPTSGDVLEYDGVDYNPVPVNAREVQGETVSATTPTTGQVMEYTGSQWEPQDPPTGLIPKFVDTVAGSSSTYSVPANTLGADGDRLVFRASGDVSGGAATVELSFGGSTILSVSVSSGRPWMITGEIIRTGSSAQDCWGILRTDDGSGQELDLASLAEDLTASQDLDISQNGGAGSLTVDTMTVEFIEAP